MSTNNTATATSIKALHELINGNARYVTSKLIHPRQTADRRSEVASGQNPFAIILGCADSRVSPEVIFDQGLGDLFVIRVAGNIIDDAILGSIEYAAEHFHTPLIVVLGHSNCGAVGATVAGGELEGHLPSLTKAIQPAVELAKTQDGDLLDNSVKANAKIVTEQLKTSQPILSKLVNAGKLEVVAARYDLDSGQVDFLL